MHLQSLSFLLLAKIFKQSALFFANCENRIICLLYTTISGLFTSLGRYYGPVKFHETDPWSSEISSERLLGVLDLTELFLIRPLVCRSFNFGAKKAEKEERR